MQSSQIEWAKIHAFSNDNTGFYEKWCIVHDGVWFEPAECRFEKKIDYDVAMMNLESTKLVEISGRYAEQICDKMNLVCSDDVVLAGNMNTITGNTEYVESNYDVTYHFQIIGESLFFKPDNSNDRWELVITNSTKYADDDGKYAHLWQFPGDELGYYESWCNVFDGDWLDKTYECGFKDIRDYNAAKKDLDYVLRPSIEGEKAKIFCEILHKECDERTVFRANYDPRTDVTYYEGFLEGFGSIVIRMIDNSISYANSYDTGTWFEWNPAPEILEKSNLQNNETLSPSTESSSFKILQYGLFDAEDDGNLVEQLHVGETYWFSLEYQNELDARQKVRVFIIMQDKDTDNVLRKIDGRGFENPEAKFGHGFEWVPKYEGEFKINGEFRTLDDPFVSAVIPQYNFVVVKKS